MHSKKLRCSKIFVPLELLAATAIKVDINGFDAASLHLGFGDGPFVQCGNSLAATPAFGSFGRRRLEMKHPKGLPPYLKYAPQELVSKLYDMQGGLIEAKLPSVELQVSTSQQALSSVYVQRAMMCRVVPRSRRHPQHLLR